LDRGQSTLFPASLEDYVTDPTPPIRLRLFRARIRASQARKLLAQCQCCTTQTGGKQPEGPQWRKQPAEMPGVHEAEQRLAGKTGQTL